MSSYSRCVTGLVSSRHSRVRRDVLKRCRNRPRRRPMTRRGCRCAKRPRGRPTVRSISACWPERAAWRPSSVAATGTRLAPPSAAIGSRSSARNPGYTPASACKGKAGRGVRSERQSRVCHAKPVKQGYEADRSRQQRVLTRFACQLGFGAHGRQTQAPSICPSSAEPSPGQPVAHHLTPRRRPDLPAPAWRM